ncbi:MAG: glycoside hydrolase family 25 protein [Oscillospiraceae bacterium]|nr:glycoside hydrolase family 25 protein [Oscillospiraceae bacterium]
MGIMDILEELSDWAEGSAGEEIPEDVQPEALDAPEEPVYSHMPELIPTEETEPEAEEASADEEITVTEVPDADMPTLEEVIAAARKKPRLRPEWIMGGIAVLCALLLGVVLALGIPHMGADEEDPEAHRHAAAMEAMTEPPQETILEPTVSETEAANPTIPPERNPYDRYDFQYNRHNYLLLQNVTSYAGIDVSAYQGEIDWKKVKASGIDFAIIRLGYRGYESGKLVEDKYAKANLEGAKEAGLRVGAYFFSQALSIKETDQEIAYMLDILGATHLDMPIVLDWEIPASNARTASMDARTLTDIQRHFCGQMRDRGYTPMVYFNWHQSENLYYLSELEDYPFWLALYQDRMTYPWRVEMWQWTASGRVPGIKGDVDINVYMPH